MNGRLKKSRRFSRLLRLMAVVAVFSFFLWGGLFLLAATRLSDVASWGFSKAIPEAVLDLKDVRIPSIDRIVVGKLTIRDKKSGEILLKMEGGAATFSFRGLWDMKISEVRLSHPMISISPHFLRVFSHSGSSKNSSKGFRNFSVGLARLVCDEGDIQVRGLGEEMPDVDAKFSFDLRNLTFAPSPIKQSVILWAISAKHHSPQPFLQLDRMEVSFTMQDLMQSHLERIRIQGGKLTIGQQLRSLTAGSGQKPAPTPAAIAQNAAPLPAWTVGAMDIFRVMVAMEEEHAGISQIHFQLTTRLKDIALGVAANNLGSTLQTVQLSNISIYSPRPPGNEVLTLNTVFIRFRLQDLLYEKIEEVVLLYPTIYLGEDLFAYMDSMSQPGMSPTSAKTSAGSGWTIRRLRVDFGNLVIGGNNDKGVGLPVKFETDIQNIALDNLAALKINAQLNIPEEKYEFASYQLEFKSKSGEMQFAYPPEKGINNVVTTLKLASLRWRQYQFQDPWLGVTFDHKGINGKFGAKAYDGYLSGGFSFLFQTNSPWAGWVGGRKIDLRQLTNIISPQNVTMTGPLNFALQLNALSSHIERLKGAFYVGAPGKMHVEKINDLLRELPKEWSVFKQSTATIGLGVLRDFEYKKAVGNFWFVESQGILNLNLSGPKGSRKFGFVVHTNELSSDLWEPSATTTQ